MTTATEKTPQTQVPQLSPPWVTIANQIKHTVGLTPGITVGDLDTTKGPYVLPITAQEPNQAQALATILRPDYSLGNIQVQVQITPGAQPVKPAAASDTEQVKQAIQTALKGNPLLVDVLVRQAGPWGPQVVWPIFSKSVVQFYNDDLSDYYNNFNQVAAAVFRSVLREQINGVTVSCSTNNE